MADFSIIGQVFRFKKIKTIKYDHDTSFQHFSMIIKFITFTEGSGGSFLGLILLKIVIFSQLNDFNEPKFIIQQ